MEAFKRQANKLREQVAKQQQAVLKQLGHFNNDGVIADEADLQFHEQLQKLYASTRAAKHFQKDLVRGVEAFVTTSSKQMEIVRKLAEDCAKYGNENQDSGFPLPNASLHFGTSHNSMEQERESLLNIIGSQVSEPLRTSIAGAPLEDARHLTHRYDRLRQDVEAQAAEVFKRQSKSKDGGSSAENSVKLQNAEARLSELKSTMMALGKEAKAAMSSVEAKQQQLTYHRLVTMVDAEKSYHRNVATILEKLHTEMIQEKQQSGLVSQSETSVKDVYVKPAHANADSNGSAGREPATEDSFFIAQVIHPFDAQADGELTLCVGDYIVVRQVSPNGWSEGEYKGKAGWFPSAYIEKRDKAPSTEVIEDGLAP